MIDLYYWPTPNGHKITMFLEEAGLDYTIHPVDISAGDQFKPDFLAISPNNRMPAIIDTAPADGGEPISVFESGAILLYLAEKTAVRQRPGTQPAYARGEPYSNRPTVTEEGKKILFGQTAVRDRPSDEKEPQIPRRPILHVGA
jgi:glutathione S-transferase